MHGAELLRLIKTAAIAGNIIFIAWVLFNSIDSGWKGTPAEIMSSITLLSLLALNSYLILVSSRR